ncbi:hypothetical protein HZB90_01240 [archaeon]|nr:hypothetical protein [archaeon]
MEICRTCGKALKPDEEIYCASCAEFHDYWYSEDERQMVLDEYERSRP